MTFVTVSSFGRSVGLPRYAVAASEYEFARSSHVHLQAA